jgi:hypothetical protein
MSPGHVAYSIAYLDFLGGTWKLVRDFSPATPHLDRLFPFVPVKAGITKDQYTIVRHHRNSVDFVISTVIFKWDPIAQGWEPTKDKHMIGRLDNHPAAVKDRLHRAGLLQKETI